MAKYDLLGKGAPCLDETSFWKTPAAVLLYYGEHKVIKGSVNQLTDSSR